MKGDLCQLKLFFLIAVVDAHARGVVGESIPVTQMLRILAQRLPFTVHLDLNGHHTHPVKDLQVHGAQRFIAFDGQRLALGNVIMGRIVFVLQFAGFLAGQLGLAKRKGAESRTVRRRFGTDGKNKEQQQYAAKQKFFHHNYCPINSL